MIYNGLFNWAGMAIESAERTIQDSLEQFHNPKHSSTTCTAGTKTIGFFAVYKNLVVYLKKTGTTSNATSSRGNEVIMKSI